MDCNAYQEPSAQVRTGLGCGKKQAKALLQRLVLDEKNQPLLDRLQGAPGRGAYLCGPGCLQAAAKRKAFQRAFRKNGVLDVIHLEAELLRQTNG